MVEAVTHKPVDKMGWRPRDLAKALNVAPHIIYQAISAGEFGTVWRLGQSGKAIVIPAGAVERWLESKEYSIGNAVA